MAGYTYDTTGQSYFFLLTVLLLFLVPFTYVVLRGGSERSAARVQYPCKGWNAKSTEVRRYNGGASSFLSVRHILLAIGWVAFAVVVQRASTIEGEAIAFDPFKILGVSSSATEKEIKKHYRRASLKFHPDKLTLAVNQTLEEANNIFVEMTKAYKALTDEVSRHNYEMFGHPDGKQEFSQGIALPSWVVESQNVWWVMGAYALVLGVMLPYFVGRWWYSTRKLTKDGVLNTTAAIYFHALKEDTTFPQLLDILSASEEFTTDAKLLKLRKSIGKAGIDEYARVTSLVREGPDGKEGWEGYATWPSGQKRARVLISAHLLRIPIKDTTLLKEKLHTITLALPLCQGLTSIVLSHNWLSGLISVLHLQQFLLQAVHPSLSPLLQLPHISNSVVDAAGALGVENVTEFGKLGPGQVEKLLPGLSDSKRKDVFEVAKHWPVTSFVDAKFQVTGEKVVTPAAVVSFIIKLRLTPPGLTESTPVVTSVTVGGEQEEEGKESSIEELIGRRKPGEEGEEPTPLAHAPHFPKNRKPTWSIFVGDHKLNRVFVAPHKFTDMGPNSVRTIRMSFQAPPGAGLYTFQVYAMSDSFVGTDAQKDMRMQVDAPATGEEELVGEEDEISEPDEDTIAGQMALMKGQSVRRAPRDDEDDDDDTSGTEESESEEETSDSDSD